MLSIFQNEDCEGLRSQTFYPFKNLLLKLLLYPLKHCSKDLFAFYFHFKVLLKLPTFD